MANGALARLMVACQRSRLTGRLAAHASLRLCYFGSSMLPRSWRQQDVSSTRAPALRLGRAQPCCDVTAGKAWSCMHPSQRPQPQRPCGGARCSSAGWIVAPVAFCLLSPLAARPLRKQLDILSKRAKMKGTAQGTPTRVSQKLQSKSGISPSILYTGGCLILLSFIDPHIAAPAHVLSQRANPGSVDPTRKPPAAGLQRAHGWGVISTTGTGKADS